MQDNIKQVYSAMTQSLIPMIVTDVDGKIIFASRGIEFVSGYSPEEVVGKNPSLWGKQMSKDFYKNFWDTIKVQKKVFKGELVNKNKSGQIYPVEIEVVPILGKDGEVDFFIGTEHDITKRKEATRSQDEFIALVSHQLRTPLTAVKWLIEILLQEKYGVLNNKQVGAIIDIYDSNERLINLVNDLLNVNEIEAISSSVTSLSVMNLSENLKQIIKIYKQLAASKKQKIVLKADKIPETVFVNQILYSQVIQNLLSNALNYGKPNSTITISLEKEKDFIISRVINLGETIPLVDQQKLFSKFFRGEDATKLNTRGSGLGLYIAKQAVEKMGGEINFYSAKGKTEFYFDVPVKEPAPEEINDK